MTDDNIIKKHWRTIFISDIHLGSRLANAKALNEFLKRNTCDHLFLVGDIIDFWALNGGIYLPDDHLKIIRKIIKRASTGTKVTYVPGNHDEILRDFAPTVVGSIEIVEEAIFTTASGKTYVVLHGDKFDVCMQHARWLVYVGDFAYTLLLRLNVLVNFVRKKFGFGYWSLSAYAKSKVKQAVNFIGAYEEIVAGSVKSHGATGAICGHIHTAEMRHIDGVHYINCGDFCESLTAVVEEDSGELHLLRYEDWSK